MMTAECPICFGATSPIWSKENFQLYQFPIEADNAARSFRMTLRLLFCDRCHHAHIWPSPDDAALESFYACDYGAYTSPLESGGLTATINEPCFEFVRHHIMDRGGTVARIAEIGGFDGYLLAKLKGLADHVLLIEASETGAAIARKHGIPVLQTFFDEAVARQLTGQFDIVICRHVIEHVRDPGTFLRQLIALLRPDGVLVIETPDLASILANVLVRTVSLQHLHLFSPRSLALLMTSEDRMRIGRVAFPNASAFILSAVRDTGGHAVGRQFAGQVRDVDNDNIIKANATAFSKRLEEHNSRLTAIIKRWKQQSKRIWIWGAGTAAGELFNVYGQQREGFLGYIDSDRRKAGMRFPAAPDLPICGAEQAEIIGVDAVLITTFSVQEVIETMRKLCWEVEVSDIYSCREPVVVGRQQ